MAIGRAASATASRAVRLTEGVGQRRFVAQQRGEISQSHGASRLPSGSPPRSDGSVSPAKFPWTCPVTRLLVRIVSLLPSATEILFELGLGDDVVGVTFECDFPVAAALEADRVDLGAAGGADAGRDRRRGQAADGRRRGPLPPRRGAFADLDPTLVVTQDLCAVCAIDVTEVDDALQWLGCRADVRDARPVDARRRPRVGAHRRRGHRHGDRAAAIVAPAAISWPRSRPPSRARPVGRRWCWSGPTRRSRPATGCPTS